MFEKGLNADVKAGNESRVPSSAAVDFERDQSAGPGRGSSGSAHIVRSHTMGDLRPMPGDVKSATKKPGLPVVPEIKVCMNLQQLTIQIDVGKVQTVISTCNSVNALER